MIALNINLAVRPVKNIANGELISYGDGRSFGIAFQPYGNNNIGILSLSEAKLLLALDDWGESHDAFRAVGIYGTDYFIDSEQPCGLASHASQLKPGSIVLKDDNIFMVVSATNPSGGVRCVNLLNGKSVSADAVGYDIGYYVRWSVRIRTVLDIGSAVTLMTKET